MLPLVLNKKPVSSFRVAVLTAVVTLLVAWGVVHMLGYHRAHMVGPPVEKGEGFLYTCGMHPWIISEDPGNCPICGMQLTPKRDQPESPETGEKTERKIAYWRAPMNPTEIYDQPGKSAMGMDLVPVYEDEVIGGVSVKIDPVTQQNMGIRTVAVAKEPLSHTIRTYGHVTYDETRTTQVSPKFSGWIENLHVDFTGQFVEKGQPLFEIYSPELLTAQEEYLVAYRNLSRMSGKGAQDLLASARRRLQYFDVGDEEIRAIEKSGQVRKTLTIRSPFSGFVTAKRAAEGVFVNAGTMVYRIADLSRVWVEAHVYEYELPWVAEGQDAEMTLPYQPGKVFSGKVSYVYPYLQRQTRDVVIRLDFENPDMQLKPNMYADVRIKTTPKGEGLVIPSEAVIRSGERNVAFVMREGGKFTPREVTLGLTLDSGKVQVLTGLAPGESVVTSGQFLLDSESKLKEAVQKMLESRQAKPKEAEKSEKEEDFFEDMQEEEDFFNDPAGNGIDLKLMEHISPITWDNVILYGEYVLNRNLVRP
jgi:Cu(I)/Ag(I) efflux system membrane fusion protein/cobalt-zinc-cadmium efflux system membrane fusion protein